MFWSSTKKKTLDGHSGPPKKIKRQHRETLNPQPKSLEPLRFTTQWTRNKTQSGFRMTFLHFMATPARLRKIKRQHRETLNPQPKSFEPVRFTTQWTHNKTQSGFRMTLLHFMATPARQRNAGRGTSNPPRLPHALHRPPPPSHTPSPALRLLDWSLPTLSQTRLNTSRHPQIILAL